MPYPRKRETKEQFIQRYLKDQHIQKEIPAKEKRLENALYLWKDRK